MPDDKTPAFRTLGRPLTPPTLSARLRAETRPAHEALEDALDLDASLASREAYGHLLGRFYAFHAGWEPVLAQIIADPAFFQPRRKLRLLAADLRYLGLTVGQIDAIAPHPPATPLNTPSQAYGALYVLEGSTLGGQLISRQVAARLGLGAEGGAQYYNAYGSAVGAMWRTFGQRLVELAPSLDNDAVVAAATTTFGQMQACLSR